MGTVNGESRPVTVDEAAHLLGISRQTIYSWIRRGKLHESGHVRHPRKARLYELAELRALANDDTPTATPGR